ncbi:urease accessory protein UreD [Ahrensia marina]|uniref:urease accessory protein UreD n=1 Tax=Ahrensia marina TaxID=1514904 RepID=UPI0035D0EA7D
MNHQVSPPTFQRTQGCGRISVKHSGDRTRIDRLYQQGAARIRVPDHPGRSDLEAVIINTAGGVTGGDNLAWEAAAGAGTNLTVTTQACEKVYKADQDTANVNVRLDVATGATLNWLPQETILFDQARLSRTIEAHLHGNASLLLVEPVIFGRRAMNETVRSGLWHDTWRIHHNNCLIHAENVRLSGEIAQILDRNATLHGHTALATLALVGNHAEGKLAGARALLADGQSCSGGASCWTVADANKLIVRLAARDGYTLRQALIPLINYLAAHGQHAAAVPKIWSL